MVSDSPLQRAIDALSFNDVYIARTEAWLADGFEPQYSDTAQLEISWKHVVTQSQVATLVSDEGDERLLFRVMIDLGMRLNEVKDQKSEKPDADEETSPSDNSDLDEIYACVEASFVAEYEMKGELDEEAMRTFSLNNASYHVWPYWREYLMSQCTRMNLPKVAVPARQFAQNRSENS
ncbi:hypothetical protein T5B8_14305 [Salinisphaera sp. T5B8]|uniref:preprotein translocase subunit SecB n=1 Tax=Salinisphaera sp. T5B8 TaxID=1304154 RepID=UPI00333F6784